jgi:hypothetical protein
VTDVSRLIDLLATCHDDPDLFNSAILGREPFWRGQVEIAQSIVDYRITAVYTGNAVGKDYLVGSVIPWWLCTRYQSLVIVTGPSQTVLGSVTWKEVRRAIEGSKFPLSARFSQGIKSSPQTVTLGTDWQALGFSTTSVERASGQHNRKLLCIVEEASGVEDAIYDAIDSLKYVRLLLIGNPIRATGRFVELIRQAEKDKQDGIPKHRACNAIRIQSTDSPDAHLEESPRGLADKTWLADVARRYGVDSLWYRSHVRAEIPSVSSDRLIPNSWLDWAAASVRPPLRPFDPVHATRRISCDLGEGVGRDSTCIIVRDDLGILECIAGNALGLAEAAAEIDRLARKWRIPIDEERITYDRVGVGRDLRNHLARYGIRAIGYAGAGSAKDKKGFTNLRSEAAWKLRQRLNPDWSIDPKFPEATRQIPFHLPPNQHWPQLRQELEALTYDLVGNQTRLIKKEDLCDILGRSPDRSDALIQSFAF